MPQQRCGPYTYDMVLPLLEIHTFLADLGEVPQWNTAEHCLLVLDPCPKYSKSFSCFADLALILAKRDYQVLEISQSPTRKWLERGVYTLVAARALLYEGRNIADWPIASTWDARVEPFKSQTAEE
ncbi:hypothetical protein NDU88_006279 [Pleurodeles waltl]|uniref:Uncharacterized protein n=1 Tax=Pleurodeles waltl TaxID=8319 RepID=A0AAV7X183_PLEWA|nr:hypothetical protein NDU88_006279 [Pleurodeles waltl]